MKFSLALTLLLLTNVAMAESVLVKLHGKFDPALAKKTIGKWSKFTNYQSKYFNSLYRFESEKKLSEKDINYLTSFKAVKSVERIAEVKATSIDPADISTAKSKDPLYVYQWGLDFQSQKVYNELSDIENYVIRGKDSADINVPNLDELDLKFKKDPVVAVIDTGVDYRHGDLKNNIFVNEVECENGEIPFGVTVSNDDNDLPGDCKGWNFTGRSRKGNNRPEDFVGHGTHIAGIISATRNNDFGISGISNHIKILPIKVLSNKKEDSQAIGTSDRLTKAILYAVQMKADAINLSLGWPLSFDKDHLRNAVMEAVNNGVTVIAAAGNNDHSEPIMPCGYEGVICVGSSDPDQKISDFSNYGAHVDVLAPGNNILSTYPTANTPMFFDINGFEIKSGTSQAAPYVAALVATLKGVNPAITEDEVRAKVFGSTSGSYVQEKKFSNGSLINFQKALTESKKVLKPIFKGFNRVKVTKADKAFSFMVKLSDYGTNVTEANITVTAPDSVVLNQTNFTLDANQREIQVTGALKTLDINLIQKFALKVEHADAKNTYNFEKRFYMDFTDLDSIKTFKIVGADPRALKKFSTVNYHHVEYDFPYYYTNRRAKTKDGIDFDLFTKVGDQISLLGKIKLKDAKRLLSVHRLDANLDGKADILIRTLIERDKEGGTVDEDGNVEQEQTIMYSYLTEELKPLFSTKGIDHSHMLLKFEGVILQDLGDFAFGKVEFGQYGKILMPVYMTYADVPEADTNPNPFARLRRRAFSANIFFYEPAVKEDNTVELTTRSINNNKFVDKLKRKIRFRPFEQIFMVKFSKQSFADIKNGEFSILISHESERKLPRNYTVKFTDVQNRKWSLSKHKGEGLNLSSFIVERGFDLSQAKLFRHQVENKIVGYEKSSRLSWEEFTLNEDRLDYVSITQENIFDPLEYPIRTYFGDNKTYRLYITPSRIYMELTSGEEQTTLSYPVHVSSFLPGMLFREQHYPISFKQGNKNIPALYVDSTQIASRNIYTILTDEKGIYAPVRFNVNIPENCKALNPVIVEGYKYEYSIQCFNKDKSSTLIYVPLEVE